MPNPIPAAVRGKLFVFGILVGIFSTVLGPLIIALDITDEWAGVILSFVGAVNTALNLLARANLSSDVLTGEVGHVELDTDTGYEALPEVSSYDSLEKISQTMPVGKHDLNSEDAE